MSVLLRDPKVCIFYLKGTCAFGYRCTKTHGEPLIEGSKDANGKKHVLKKKIFQITKLDNYLQKSE